MPALRRIELSETEFVDYYDFLMVSPQADRAMLEWAIRHMLTRYGPKNAETADAAKYEQTKAAYRALVDPAKRAEYDATWKERNSSSTSDRVGSSERRGPAATGQLPINNIIVETAATIDDVHLQIKLRQAVVSALYSIMITNPRQPETGRAEVAKAVGCRVDDLEFSIWFLRESGLIKTSNAGDYAITAEGVQWVEQGGVPHLTPAAKPPKPVAASPASVLVG